MRIGIVTQTDPATCKARVKFPDHDNVESFWLPVVQPKTLADRFYLMPDIDEHVVCLLDENGESGVILGAIYSDAGAPPVNSQDKWHVTFDDGTILEYDRASHLLKADVKGAVDLDTTGNVTATIGGTLTATVTGESTITTPKLTVNGNVQINGTLDTTGNIKGNSNITAGGNVGDQNGTKTMAGMRTVFNTHTHNHPGDGVTIPQPGTGM